MNVSSVSVAKSGFEGGGESDRSERQDDCLSTRCFSVNYAIWCVSSENHEQENDVGMLG